MSAQGSMFFREMQCSDRAQLVRRPEPREGGKRPGAAQALAEPLREAARVRRGNGADPAEGEERQTEYETPNRNHRKIGGGKRS